MSTKSKKSAKVAPTATEKVAKLEAELAAVEPKVKKPKVVIDWAAVTAMKAALEALAPTGSPSIGKRIESVVKELTARLERHSGTGEAAKKRAMAKIEKAKERAKKAAEELAALEALINS